MVWATSPNSTVQPQVLLRERIVKAMCHAKPREASQSLLDWVISRQMFLLCALHN